MAPDRDSINEGRERVTTSERFIFISHSGEDTWVARQIAREIAARGASPFLDEAQIAIGEEFEDVLLKNLDKAHELVVLITPWALQRPYVWAELGAAWLRQIPIVVVLHGISPAEFQAQPNALVFLKKRNMISLNDIDKYLDELSERMADHA